VDNTDVFEGNDQSVAQNQIMFQQRFNWGPTGILIMFAGYGWDCRRPNNPCFSFILKGFSRNGLATPMRETRTVESNILGFQVNGNTNKSWKRMEKSCRFSMKYIQKR